MKRIISFISTILTGSLGLYAQTTDVSICPGESRMLRITAPDSEVTYTWYKDGVVISDIEVDTISVNEPGVYVVMSVNAGGCQSALSEPVIVRHNSMIAYNDWIVVAESTSISIQTWANDSIGCVGIDTLHTQLVSEPTQGIVTRGEDGQIIYTPLTGYTGLDSFQYQSQDWVGNLSNIATVYIEVIGAPLNTQWLSFEAHVEAENVRLDWQIPHLHDQGYFIIERSQDTRYFDAVNTVSAFVGQQEYSLLDTLPLLGQSFYRIKLMSINNELLSISPVRRVNIEPSFKIDIFPNPTHNIVIVRTSPGQILSQLEIITVQGVILETITPQSEQTSINLGSYPSGVYYLRCTDTNRQQVHVFPIQKLS